MSIVDSRIPRRKCGNIHTVKLYLHTAVSEPSLTYKT